MDEKIAGGYIDIAVKSDVAKEMAAIEGQVDAAMKKIDNKKAEVLLSANDAGLKKKIENAERKLDSWEAKKATATVDVDHTKADKGIAEVKAELATLKDKKLKVELNNKEFEQRFQKSLKAIEKGERDLAAAESQIDKKRARDRLRQARIRNQNLQKEDAALYVSLNKLYIESQKVRADAAKATARQQARLDKSAADNYARVEEAKTKALRDALAKRESLEKDARTKRESSAKSELAKKKAAWASEIQLTKKAVEARKKLEETSYKAGNTSDKLANSRAVLAAQIADLRAHGNSLVGQDKEVNDQRIAEAEKFHARLLALQEEADKLVLRSSTSVFDTLSTREKVGHGRAVTELKSQTTEIIAETRRRVNATARLMDTEQRNRERDADNVAQLTSQYIAQQRRVEKLRQRTKGASALFMPDGERRVLDLDISAGEEKLNGLRSRLDALGEPPPQIDLDVNSERGIQQLSKFTRALSDTTVRLGPFTTTIAGAARVLAVLGPLVNGVVGAAGALAGALGAGLGGGLGLAAAGFTGIIPLVGGFAATMVPAFKNLGAVYDAQNKVNDAVLKYGKGSKEASKAQQQYNQVLKGVPASTRSAFQGLEQLRKGWRDGTKEVASRNLGTIMNDGISAANSLLPMFVGQVNKFSDNVTKGLSGWFDGLKSARGEKVLNDTFSAINKGVQPAMAGLGNLGSAFGTVIRSFAQSADRLNLGEKFTGWTKGISEGLKNLEGSGQLGRITDNLTKNFLSVGKAIRSTANLLGTFFYQAANSGGGMDFLDDISEGMDRLTDKMRAGGMDDFLGQSIETTKNLAAALKPIGSMFMEWTTITAPIVNALLKAVTPVLQLTAAFLGLGAVKGIITGLFAAFAFGKLVGGIGLAVTAIGRLTAAFRGLAAAQGVASASAAIAGGGALRAASAVTGGAAGNAASAMGRQAAANKAAMAATAGNAAALARLNAAQNNAARGATKVGEATSKTSNIMKGALATQIAASGPRVTQGLDNAGKGLEKNAQAATKFGRATSAAGKATKTFGSGLTALLTSGASVNPLLGAAIVGVGALTYGVYGQIKAGKAWREQQAKGNQALATYRETLGSIPDLNSQTLQSTLALTQGQKDYASVNKQINKLQREGKTSGQVYNGLLAERARLQTQNTAASQQQRSASNAEIAASKKLVTSTKERLNAAKEEAKQYATKGFFNTRGTDIREAASKLGGKDSIGYKSGAAYGSSDRDLPKIYEAIKNKAQAAGKSVAQYADELQRSGQLSKDEGGALNGYLKRMAKAETANKTLAEAQRKSDIANINNQRAMRELGSVTEKTGNSLLKLKSVSAGAYDAAKFNKNYNDRDIRSVSQASRSALASGASEKKVIDIVANSKSAEDAIRRLNALNIPKKTLEIADKGGPQAVAQIEKIIGKKIPKKDAEIVAKGGERAMAVISRITGQKVPQKVVNVVSKGGPQAIKILGDLQGTKLTTKQLAVASTGADGAMVILRQIQGTKLSEKQLRVASSGAEGARLVLDQLNGKQIDTKRFNVLAETGQARAQIDSLANGTPKILLKPELQGGGGSGFLSGLFGGAAAMAQKVTVTPVLKPIPQQSIAPLKVPIVPGKIAQPKLNVKPVTIPFKPGKFTMPKTKASAVTVPVKVSKFTIPKAKAATVTVPVKAGKVPSIKAPKAPSVTVRVKTGNPPAVKPPRTPAPVQIRAKDATGSAVSAANGRLKSVKTPPQVPIRANWAGQGAVGQANNALGSVRPDVRRTITTVYQTVGSPVASRASGGGNVRRTIKVYKPKKAKSKAAGGAEPRFEKPTGMASPPNMRKIERAADTAAMSAPREIRGGRVSTPRYLVGEEGQSEYVIATNPRYRKRNQEYLVQAMNTIGLPSDGASRVASFIRNKFVGKEEGTEGSLASIRGGNTESTTSAAAGGSAASRRAKAKAKKARAIKKGTSYARGQVKRKIGRPKASSYNSEGISGFTDIDRAERNEELAVKAASQYEASIKEPDTFLVPTGAKDSNGDPIMKIDEQGIKDWNGKLAALQTKYKDLADDKIAKVKAAIAETQKQLDTKLRTSKSNYDKVKGLDNQEKKKKKQTAGIKARRAYYAEVMAGETKTQKDVAKDKVSLGDKDKDADNRRIDYQQQATDVGDEMGKTGKSDRESAAAAASAEESRANTAKAEAAEQAKSDADSGRYTDQAAISRLDAEDALAKIGIGVNGAAVRDQATRDAERLAANQAAISRANGLLRDNDPTNDADAYSTIASAANNIQGLNEAGSGIGDVKGLGSARDALAAMSGNAYGSGPQGFAAMMNGGASAMGSFAPGNLQSASGVPTAGQTVNKSVVNNNYFPQAPDPLTFSKNVAYELNAAL